MTTDPLSLVGTCVAEKYDVQAVVGEGGFAVVYRAQHRVWDRPVALKVFKALGAVHQAHREQLLEAFLREGALLAELSERSSAICQARDVGMLEGQGGRAIPYMVLEWLDGASLESVMNDEQARRLPPRTPVEVLHFLRPVGEALALAHRRGIAHRDVKPANIFVLGDPRGEHTLKLLDFGIAKVVQDAQRDTGAFAQTQGHASSFTPAYGAPEQFVRAKGATGPWTDVFALGLVFTELVTHAPALRGDDLTQLAFASMDPARRPTPRAAGTDVGAALEAVLAKAVAVEPKDRYQTAGELWEALVAALRVGDEGALRVSAPLGVPAGMLPVVAASAPPSPPAPMPLPAAKKASSPAAMVAMGMGLVAVLAGVGLAARAVLHKEPAAVTPTATTAALTPTASAPPSASAATAPSCPPGMVYVRPGKFFMGSDDKNDDEDEHPAHQVALAGFCLDRTEVTVAAYKACSDRGDCKRAGTTNDFMGITKHQHEVYDPLCNAREPEARGEHPINCVDWQLAHDYCAAVGKRLPTEAEWEYATRGSDGRRYTWGDADPTGEHLNACGSECVAWGKAHREPLTAMYAMDDGFPNTAPVGSFPKGASPFGIEDVMGNVGEWVADFYGPYPKSTGLVTSPTGAVKGGKRVVRGGGWNGADPAWVRPSFRFSAPPVCRSHGIGFRCAKDEGVDAGSR